MLGALGIFIGFFGYTLIYCGVKNISPADEIMFGFGQGNDPLLAQLTAEQQEEVKEKEQALKAKPVAPLGIVGGLLERVKG